MKELEEWKDIKGYEGKYAVSVFGEVYSYKRHKCLKARKNRNGYCGVNLGGKEYRIHRLVAEAFIPNPDNLPFVNHKDENPENNCVENLEWCSASYNINYGTRNERCIESRMRNGFIKPILMLDIFDEFLIKEFPSIQEAAEYVGGHRTHICACCNNRKRSAYGYKWQYKSIFQN